MLGLNNIAIIKITVNNWISILSIQPTAIVPNHSRTGSSPAVIQQPIPAPQYQYSPQPPQQTGNPATRWESPQISSDFILLTLQIYIQNKHIS
jgi:hypothetical protein